MTGFTDAGRQDVQKALEGGYEASIQYYRELTEISRENPSIEIYAKAVDREAEQVAKMESLLGQFSKEVPTDKLTLAERTNIADHLRQNKDRALEIFKNNKYGPGIEVAEADILLESFNTVTQRQRAQAIPKPTHRTARMSRMKLGN